MFVRCREEFVYQRLFVLYLKALTAKNERIVELSLGDVCIDLPYEGWYGLTRYEIFGYEHFHEARLRANDGLLVSLDQRFSIVLIPPKLRPTLFAPISGVFEEFRLLEP